MAFVSAPGPCRSPAEGPAVPLTGRCFKSGSSSSTESLSGSAVGELFRFRITRNVKGQDQGNVSGEQAFSGMGDGNREQLRTALRPRSASTAANSEIHREPLTCLSQSQQTNNTTCSDMLRPRPQRSAGTTTSKTKVVHGAFRAISEMLQVFTKEKEQKTALKTVKKSNQIGICYINLLKFI